MVLNLVSPASLQQDLLFASPVQRTGMYWHLDLGHRTVVIGRCKPLKKRDIRKPRFSAGMDEEIGVSFSTSC
jgi:hypothetical protein